MSGPWIYIVIVLLAIIIMLVLGGGISSCEDRLKRIEDKIDEMPTVGYDALGEYIPSKNEELSRDLLATIENICRLREAGDVSALGMCVHGVQCDLRDRGLLK